MRILIIGFTKIKYMPYLRLYYENIDKSDNQLGILFWNRDGQSEDTEEYMRDNISLYEFCQYQEDEVSRFFKISSFIKYRQFAKSTLKDFKPDSIIVLHTLPGVLIFDILCKRFSNNYLLDYRDSTYEHNNFFKLIIGKLVDHSRYTFVSSDGFRKYLPNRPNKIFTSHNILLDSLCYRNSTKSVKTNGRIRIAFWGFIRHKDVNAQIIKKIGSDTRFELHYYGREQETADYLKKLVVELKIDNVFFHGEYKPKDRYSFITKNDLIHNIYYDSNTMLAMGNKFYDGIVFRIPQICMEGSFMGECVSENGLGIQCNPYNDSFLEDIYYYFSHLDRKRFDNNCDLYLERILKEYNGVSDLIKNTYESGIL